ncbi:BspA family leucine-rich repeat surface protein [Flagellimonas marinaquae]
MKVKKLIWLFVATLSLWSCNEEDEGYPIATNRGPVMLAQSFNPLENISDTDIIGTIKAFDADGDALSYSLTMNDGDMFELTSDGELSLATGKNLDFETKGQHSITVAVTDGITNPITNNITIEVKNVIEDLFEDPASFITEWEVVAGQALTIGTNAGYDYDFTIDWGDGSGENELMTQNPTHEYTNAGTYRVAIKGQFPAIRMSNTDTASKESLVSVVQWGTGKWQTMEQAFVQCINLTGFTATDMPDLSEATSMMGMFFMASTFNGSMGNWDTSAITNMQNLFMGAEVFNQSIGMWNTSNVVYMDQMFNGAAAFNQNISEWNTENVMSFSGMFMDAVAFNQNIGTWNTNQASNMQNMFNGAETFDQDLGGWNIENAVALDGMLDNSGMSAANLNATLIGWNNYVEENEGPKNITVGVDGLSICGPEVVEAIQSLTINHNWALTGELQAEADCPEEEEEATE